MTRASVLVVDDDPPIRRSIVRLLRRSGLRGIEAADARECLARASRADAVILDEGLPDRSGLEVLSELRRGWPELPIIVLTGNARVAHAVEAMKLGAFHYVAKPFELDALSGVVDDALASRQCRRPQMGTVREVIVGNSYSIRETRRLIRRFATNSSSTVLITGESGTGKDLAARDIHGESRRREGPFVNVTCSAISEHLFESELFGHERGAFTDAHARRIGLVEQATGGTLFLDELGELPLVMQAKLLRFLQDRTFRRVGGTEDLRADVRVVAATHVDLERAVRLGTFRQDLYYRLAVVRIALPPLRARIDDLPLLVQHFLDTFRADQGRSVRISRTALAVLAGRPWPGNVRELRNALERALLLSDGDELTPHDFELDEPPARVAEDRPEFALPSDGVDLETLQRSLLLQALERAQGNQRVAGEMLGMNRDQVRYRMAKFGIPSRRKRRAGARSREAVDARTSRAGSRG